MPAKGKHPNQALSAVKVRGLKTPGRYADGGGLYLVVDNSGAKRWILRTIVRGKRCDIGLGGLSTVSLAEAREEARSLRKIARGGGDPLAERRRARQIIPTFEQAARTVHAEQKQSWRNPKHAQQWINTLEEYVFPIFGSRPVDQVDSAAVLKALSSIWLSKPETARRVKQRIKSVFDWTKAAGHRVGDNPVDGVSKVLPKQPKAQHHYAALPYAEVPAFVQALHATDAAESTKLAFEFLILTAARTNEVIGATWDELDADQAVWTIAAERMKAQRLHRVPLPARCVELLEHARELSDGSMYIFTGRPGKPLSNMAFLMTIRRMGQDITAHGFRSSFRDFAAERTNIPREVCEAALAHTLRDKTEAAYHRTDLFEKRRKLMEAWEAHVTSHAADILELRTGA